MEIDTLTFPESVTFIDGYAFRYCENIKNVRVSENVKLSDGGGGVFSNCTGLISAAVINSNDMEFYSDPFFGCTSLRWVGLGRNIKEGRTYIMFFTSCSSLTDIYFEGTEAEFNAIFGKMNRYQNYNSYFLDATKHYNSTGPT